MDKMTELGEQDDQEKMYENIEINDLILSRNCLFNWLLEGAKPTSLLCAAVEPLSIQYINYKLLVLKPQCCVSFL